MDRLLMVVAALVAGGFVALGVTHRMANPRVALRALIGGLVGINGLGLLISLAVVLMALWSPLPVLAQEPVQPASTTGDVAMGAACIGAGIAVGIAGAAAIGGITEKPEILGRTLIFVGLAEGIAIYGLIISFIILSS
jgi:V/A-type H+/Na+-transporting ATPase subunit K